MKFELLHLILAEVSTWDHGMSKAVQIDGYPEEEVMKHVGYLYDEGMLNARAAVYKGGAEYYPRSLTMHGHKTSNNGMHNSNLTSMKRIGAR